MADADGFAFFYAPAGLYNITATKDDFTRTWTDVPIGSAQSVDAETILDAGYPFLFSSVVTSAAPEVGEIHFNNADLSAANLAYISKTTRNGVDIGARLIELEQGSKTEKSTISFASSNGVDAASYRVGTVSDEGDYVIASLSNHAGSTSLLELGVSIFRELSGNDGPPSTVPGPPGANFQPDEVVPTFADRDDYDDEPKNFSVLVEEDESKDGEAYVYFKLSNTSGDWSAGTAFAGGSGGGGSANRLSVLSLLLAR